MKFKALIALLFGAVVLYSCRNSGEYKVLNNQTTDSALLAADSTEATQAKLVKTANMQLKVKDVAKANEGVANLTRQYHGMVMKNHLRSYVQNSREVKLGNDSVMLISTFVTAADMTVKVPSEKLDDYMAQAAKLGVYVTVRDMDIEDHTLNYLEAQMKLDSRKQLVAQQKAGRIVLKHAEDALYFKDGLVDEQINRRRIDEAVKYSVLTLSFAQDNTIMKEVMVDSDPQHYNIGYGQRLWLGIESGISIFAEFVLLLANLWVFILCGIVLWLVYKHYKARRPAMAVRQ